MNLTPTLNNPIEVFQKLLREGSRSAQTVNQTAQADYFYNFCITSLSLRDHMFEYVKVFEDKEKVEENKKKYMEKWGKPNYIEAAHDIANSVKHFVLRVPRKYKKKILNTKKVTHEPATLTFHCTDGTRQRYDITSLLVELDSGVTFTMFDFITSVLNYWEKVLTSEGISFETGYGPNSLPPAIW